MTTSDQPPNCFCWRLLQEAECSPQHHLFREQGATVCQFCVLWQLPIKLHSARLWAQAPVVDVTRPCHSHGVSISDGLGKNMLVSGLLEFICWVLAGFMLLLAQKSIKQSCYQFVSLNWPSQPLMVYCLLASLQNHDTKLEDTENLLASIHIVVVPTWRGSKRGVAGGHHLQNNCHLLRFIEQSEMYHLPSVWFKTHKDSQLPSDACNKHSSATALHQLDLLKRYTFLSLQTRGKMLVED